MRDTRYLVNVGYMKKPLKRADNGSLVLVNDGITYTAAKAMSGYKLTNSLNNETRYASSIPFVIETIEGWARRFGRNSDAVEKREALALGLPDSYVHVNYGPSRGLNHVKNAGVYTNPSNPSREGTMVRLQLTADVETAAKILALFPALVNDPPEEEAHVEQ